MGRFRHFLLFNCKIYELEIEIAIYKTKKQIKKVICAVIYSYLQLLSELIYSSKRGSRPNSDRQRSPAILQSGSLS